MSRLPIHPPTEARGGVFEGTAECSYEVMSIHRVMGLFHSSCKGRGNLR